MKKSWLALAVFCAAALVWLASDTTSALSTRHALQSRLKSLALVTTLEVEGVGPVPMFLNPDDQVMTPSFWSGQPWEENETHWFVESVRPGDVVVDVGANIGYYTLLGAKLVGETGRVYAFEPDPVSFALLQRNIRLNGLDNVVAEQKAVSNEAGSIRLYLAETNKGDHRIYQPEGDERPWVEVEAVALDDYFEGREASVDFVKVDTQGAEAVILEGMQEIVERSPDLVMAFEFSPRHLAGFGSVPSQMLRTLHKLELEMFDLGVGGRRPLRPVTRMKLLRGISQESHLFTNLLLVKGRPDLLDRIAAQVPGRGRAASR